MTLASKTVSTVSGEFTIAPLTLAQTKKILSPESADELRASDNYGGSLSLLLMAIRNADPESKETAETLEAKLCFRSLSELSAAVFEITGLQPKKSGEAAAAQPTSGTSTAA